TQRRTDRRRRGGRARGHLQLDVTFDFLGHEWPPFSLSPRRYTEAHGKRFERAPALAKEPSRMDSRAVAVGSGAVRRNACQIQAPPTPSTSNGSVRPAPKSRRRTETRLLDQFDLFEVEFDRSRAAEDRDADLDLVLVEVELLDHAVEAGERAVQHFDLVADLVIDVDLLLGRRLGFLDAAEVAGCFALAD